MISKEVLELVSGFVENIKKQKWVIWIVLLWWLGKRNNIDKYSDLDFAVFYDDEKVSLPIFEFHVIKGNCSFEFNVHQQNYNSEIKNFWNREKRNAYNNWIVVFDPLNLIEKLIKKKCKQNTKEIKDAIINFASQYQWRVLIHSRRCVARNDNYSAHLLLNNWIEILFEMLFLLHWIFIPHHKRRFSNLKNIKGLPKNVIKNLEQALLIYNFSWEELERRINNLNVVFIRCEKKIEYLYWKIDYNEYSFRNAQYKQKDKLTKIDKVEIYIKEKWKKTVNEMKHIRWYLNYYLIDSIPKLKENLLLNDLPFDIDQPLKNTLLNII